MNPFIHTLLGLIIMVTSAEAEDYYFQEEWTGSPSTNDWHILTESPPQTLIEITTEVVHSGTHALKAQLTNPDKLYKRAEISHQHRASIQNQYFYKYSLYLPETGYPQNNNDEKTFTIISQWQGFPDFGLGEDYRQPPLSFHVNEDGDLEIITKYCARQVNDNTQNTTVVHTNSTGGTNFPLPKGEWINISLSVCWDWDSDGFLDIWMNGTQIVSYSGPTCYNDARGPYFKVGIYRTPWIKETETIYFDNLQILRNGVIIPADGDTFTRADIYSDDNFGSSNPIPVKYSTNPYYLREGYLHFDLSTFAAYDFTEADLKLTLTRTDTYPLYVDRVSDNWTESNLTYNSATNLTASNDPTIADCSQADTQLPVEYYPTDSEVSLKLYGDQAWIAFPSRENSTITQRPTLLLKF